MTATARPTDVRDMAIIHRTFRNAFGESAELVRAEPSPSPQRVAFLAEHIEFVLGMLHHHHEGEDEILYPLLAERAPEQLDMVRRIEAQHQEVTGALDAVAAATRQWRADPTAATANELGALLDRLNEVLQPHLDDEETMIVPLAAAHLSQKEWDSLGDHGIEAIPKKMMPIAFGLITDPLNDEDRAHMKAHLPAPVRLLFPVLIGRPWKKYAAVLRDGR